MDVLCIETTLESRCFRFEQSFESLALRSAREVFELEDCFLRLDTILKSAGLSLEQSLNLETFGPKVRKKSLCLNVEVKERKPSGLSFES